MTTPADPNRGPTLYDFAGVSPSADEHELLEAVAALSSRAPGASRVRAGFALEALLDERFRELYDEHLREGQSWRDQRDLPLLPPMPDAEWGSNEMGQWARATSEILRPKRPLPGRLARIGSTGQLLASRDAHRLLYPGLLVAGALPFVQLGNLPLLNVLRDTVSGTGVAEALAIAIAFLVGGVLALVHSTLRDWRARASLLVIAGMLPAVTVHRDFLFVALGLLSTVLAGATAAHRAHAVWQSSDAVPPAPESPWAPVEGRSRTRLGADTSDPVRAASVLRAWATRLGHPLASATPTDLVAAVIAADGWAFALGADSLDQAASFGPASLGAISAAVARAAGYPEVAMPLLPGPEATERLMPGLGASLQDWRHWSELQLGRRNAGSALDQAAGDLIWGGGNEDRLARIARSLRRSG